MDYELDHEDGKLAVTNTGCYWKQPHRDPANEDEDDNGFLRTLDRFGDRLVPLPFGK